MVFYIVVIVAVVAFVIWFVRTPAFRQRLSHSKAPDQAHSRADGIQYNDWKDLPPRD